MTRKNSPSKLAQKAVAVRERAYAPYSNYSVGAAVLGKSGRVYTGCNVENASFGLTCCAERSAIFKAISEGEREFDAIAVATANGGSPCGACRQVLYEFLAPGASVYLFAANGEILTETTVGALLPDGFTPRKLHQGQRAVVRKRKE